MSKNSEYPGLLKNYHYVDIADFFFSYFCCVWSSSFIFYLQIYYTGKYQSLGIKQGGPSAGKWVELPVTKSPKIAQFSVGHDGSHALLVAEDGSVFFTGSASKGEDGESSKTISIYLLKI